jgi:hypothetical protein
LGGCGSSRDARALIARAQAGLAHIHGGEIAVRAKAETPIPLERSLTLRADQLPLAQLELTRWTSHPRSFSCGSRLECARAELDFRRALQALGPLLPALPVDASSIHDTRLEVGIGKRDRKPRFLRLLGKVKAGGLLGDVPFQVELDLPA